MLPNGQAFLDSIKFSPQSAVNMLRLLDGLIAGASSNAAFNARIPLLDTSFNKVIIVAKMFTDKLYEFFVRCEEFDE